MTLLYSLLLKKKKSITITIQLIVEHFSSTIIVVSTKIALTMPTL